jgi:hypothetical protein
VFNDVPKTRRLFMEKIDTVDETNLPESVFGVTFEDAVMYSEKIEKRRTHNFINEPVRDTEQTSLWDFMGSKLPDEDDAEITSIMKKLTGEFS